MDSLQHPHLSEVSGAIAPPCPYRIDQKHWDEWRSSGVSPEIIEANVRSYSGQTALEIVTETAIAKVQRVESYVTEPAKRILKRNENVLEGGWFVAGLDPLSNWERMEWGQFKPNTPRIDAEKGKPIKYQTPEGTEARAIFLDIPSQPNYWANVLADISIVIYICEGAKKAGLLMSLGCPAIALPGIWMGGRWRDKEGKLLNPHLIPELVPFAQSGRKLVFVYDQDKKPKTRRAVAAAESNTGKLFEAFGCEVLNTKWNPSEAKGLDDGWAKFGEDWVHQTIADAAPLQSKKIVGFQVFSSGNRLDPPTPATDRERQISGRQYRFHDFLANGLKRDFTISEREGIEVIRFDDRLSALDVTARTIAIRAGLGAGKTHVILHTIKLAGLGAVLSATRNFLVRDTGGRAVKMGMPWHHFQSDVGKGRSLIRDGLNGTIVTLCAASFSEYHFTGVDWSDKIVALDEFQAIRKEIIRSPKLHAEFARMMATAKLVITADADLSDTDLDFLEYYRGKSGFTLYLQNEKKDPTPVKWFEAKTRKSEISLSHDPITLSFLPDLKADWEPKGYKRIAIACDNATKARILAEQAKELGFNVHLAWGYSIEDNQDLIKNIDGMIESCAIEILIYSPTLQNGVDIQTYFDIDLTISDGIISPTQVLQMSKRVRNAGEYWFSVPRKTVDIASVSHLQGANFDRKLDKLHQAAEQKGLCASKFWSKQGYWERLVGEVEKAYNSEYVKHLLTEAFENVETIVWQHRGRNLRDAVSGIKLADTGRVLHADPIKGGELVLSESAPSTEQQCWDIEAYQFQKLYPKMWEQFTCSLSQATTDDQRNGVLEVARIWRDKRLNRLKLLYMTQNPDDIDAEMFLGKREGYFTSALDRIKKIEHYELAKRLELWELAVLEKDGDIGAHDSGFTWWSPQVATLYERFCADSQLTELMPDIESQKEFFHAVKKCMAAMGFVKKGESIREKSDELHPNGMRNGVQRFSHSKKQHFVGWVRIDQSGSKLFQELFECIMDSIAELVEAERDQFKLRKAERQLNEAIASSQPNVPATHVLMVNYQQILTEYHQKREAIAA